MDDVSGPEAWFQSIPFITRYWFALTCITTLSGNLGLVGIDKIVFMWEPLKDNFEVWRLFTPFLYMGQFSLPMLFGLYLLVEYSKRYEMGTGFNTGAGGGTADYAFAMMFGVVVILLSYPLLADKMMPIFAKNLTYYVLYAWTKRYPTVQVNIWGFPVQALHLPFALLGLTMCMGNPFVDMMHGFAIGHLYYFLVDVVPVVYNKDVLRTPQFLIDYFGVGTYQPEPTPTQNTGRTMGASGGSVFNAPGRVNPPANPGLRRRPGAGGGFGGGYNWGSGQTLGNS